MNGIQDRDRIVNFYIHLLTINVTSMSIIHLKMNLANLSINYAERVASLLAKIRIANKVNKIIQNT